MEGGNSIIRVLGRFFTEYKDFQFVFHKHDQTRSFFLSAYESSWYDLERDELELKISEDQAKDILQMDLDLPQAQELMKVLGLRREQLLKFINRPKP